MTGIDITSIIGSDYPYEVYVCNSYGGDCVYVSTINVTVGPPVIISPLPIVFNNIPKIGIMIKSLSTGCMTFKSITCESIKVDDKEFQDSELFSFMDSIPYDFQT